jgi:hypothetical protein
VASGWLLTAAGAINNKGQIICNADNFLLNTYDAVLLTPVPEPTTSSLLGLGVLAMLRRRTGKALGRRK